MVHLRLLNWLKIMKKHKSKNDLGMDGTEMITVKLTGVTYEGRQFYIAKMNVNDQIYLRRDRNNRYDNNAIGVYNNQNQNIGWIPRDIAASLAPDMDSGVQLFTKINQILGGNGYNYGVEIFISNNVKKLRLHQPFSRSGQSYHSPANQFDSSNHHHSKDYYDENLGYLEEIEMRERAEIERDLQREFEEDLYK
ncbi:hypothetical protein CN481_04815 [Bacillus sp. AFS006103]|nr:hypothetical protein CN481_04815 [Bacillus sp. AFS006103]